MVCNDRWRNCHNRLSSSTSSSLPPPPHVDVIKWKHFPRHRPFVPGIHRPPVNSPHKGQWRRAFMYSLICAWINRWENNREAGDLRRYRTHYDVIVIPPASSSSSASSSHSFLPSPHRHCLVLPPPSSLLFRFPPSPSSTSSSSPPPHSSFLLLLPLIAIAPLPPHRNLQSTCKIRSPIIGAWMMIVCVAQTKWSPFCRRHFEIHFWNVVFPMVHLTL